ncbi:hypothetical protein LUZ60_011264 [Juncus effusus]|nr:hypothetical protein LUZ60_011264 [Juncus effusus]
MALALKHAGRAMRDAGIQGSIICTASVGASQGGNGPASYIASKHAVLGLVRAAARDLGQYRIRVNCVSPSGMATGLSIRLTGKMMTPGLIDKVNGALCNLKGKALKPRHVADAALFLASDESAMISGHNLVVDGGNLAANVVIV